MTGLITKSVTAYQKMLRQGEITSVELVQSHIDHIRKVNPDLNALIEDRFDDALDEAKAADVKFAGDQSDLPPLLGIPCTVKECFAVQGMKRTSGMVWKKDHVSSDNAVVVQKVVNAGAIILGTTNVSELCMWMESRNKLYGTTNNPYDKSRIVGGSSGGEGAIIGSGGSPFGIGSDIGGSLRMPAFFNGIWTHKSSSRLISNEGAYPIPVTDMAMAMLTPGPMTRHAEDLPLLLRVMAEKPDSFRDINEFDVSKAKIISLPKLKYHPLSKQLQDCQKQVLRRLDSHVGSTEEANVKEMVWAGRMWSAKMQAGAPGHFRDLLYGHAKHNHFIETLKWLSRTGDYTTTSLFLVLMDKLLRPSKRESDKMLKSLEVLDVKLQELMGDNGVLIAPSYGRIAPRHYTPLLTPVAFTYTSVFNALEYPVTQVPLGLDSNGLPLGIQVIAPPNQDHRCLAVAMKLNEIYGGWVPPWQAKNRVL